MTHETSAILSQWMLTDTVWQGRSVRVHTSESGTKGVLRVLSARMISTDLCRFFRGCEPWGPSRPVEFAQVRRVSCTADRAETWQAQTHEKVAQATDIAKCRWSNCGLLSQFVESIGSCGYCSGRQRFFWVSDGKN